MLILRAQVVDICTDELGDIEARQEVHPRAKRVVELEGKRIGQIEHIALGKSAISRVAISTHSGTPDSEASVSASTIAQPRIPVVIAVVVVRFLVLRLRRLAATTR